jgi:Fe2+ transport system protein B
LNNPNYPQKKLESLGKNGNESESTLLKGGIFVSGKQDEAKGYTRLRQQMLHDGITPLSAFAYLIFILLYFPCIATIAAIKNETGSWNWALIAAGYTTAVAWLASALVFQIGSLF